MSFGSLLVSFSPLAFVFSVVDFVSQIVLFKFLNVRRAFFSLFFPFVSITYLRFFFGEAARVARFLLFLPV